MHPELEQIIAKIEAEAYQRGWNAALASIVSAAQCQGMLTPERLSIPSPISFDLAKPKVKRSRGTRSGSTVALVLQYIKAHPDQTGVEIVSGLKKDHPSVEERTVRTALRRSKMRGLLDQFEGRWRAI